MLSSDEVDTRVQVFLDGSGRQGLTDAQAAASAGQLADEVYRRWCAALGEDRRSESDWLAEVSRSLQRAARVLGPAPVIG